MPSTTYKKFTVREFLLSKDKYLKEDGTPKEGFDILYDTYRVFEVKGQQARVTSRVKKASWIRMIMDNAIYVDGFPIEVKTKATLKAKLDAKNASVKAEVKPETKTETKPAGAK